MAAKCPSLLRRAANGLGEEETVVDIEFGCVSPSIRLHSGPRDAGVGLATGSAAVEAPAASGMNATPGAVGAKHDSGELDAWLKRVKNDGYLQLIDGGRKLAEEDREEARELASQMIGAMTWCAYRMMGYCYGALMEVVAEDLEQYGPRLRVGGPHLPARTLPDRPVGRVAAGFPGAGPVSLDRR